MTRALERSPGVTVARNGPPGAFTALHVRGAESEQLLVLIDGVRVADPASPGGGFDFGNLLLGNIAKLELQRSSNSTIWGSQALGGVLAVTTDAQRGVRAAAEYGAHGTLYATASAGFARGPASVGVDAAHYTSEGFSAALAGTEPDGFRQTELAGHASLALGGGFSLFARGRHAAGRLDLDGFPAPDFALADTAEYQDTRQSSGAAGVTYAGRSLELTVDVSSAQTKRENFDPALGAQPSFTSQGVSRRAELRGRWSLGPGLALDFGGESERTRFETLFDTRQSTAIFGGYAQLDLDRGPLHLAAGLRRDEHRDFGGTWSLGADAAYALSSDWRLVGSYGEGFKPPTLFQLHSDYGNAILRPERSRSYDAGIVFSRGGLDARATAFRRDAGDLIVFVSCLGSTTGICDDRPLGTYGNAAKARAQGVELEAGLRPIEALRLGAAYGYLEAEDRTPGSPARGKALARRPHHALTLTADASLGPARLGADLRAVSGSFDDAANTVPLDGFALVTLRGEYDLARSVTLFARIDNAFDERYETAAGYATARRGAYVGARGRL